MKLEPRYIVLKVKDVQAAGITEDEREAFNAVCDKVLDHRIKNGKGVLGCMVIESDWPEFKPALQMLAERIDGEQA